MKTLHECQRVTNEQSSGVSCIDRLVNDVRWRCGDSSTWLAKSKHGPMFSLFGGEMGKGNTGRRYYMLMLNSSCLGKELAAPCPEMSVDSSTTQPCAIPWSPWIANIRTCCSRQPLSQEKSNAFTSHDQCFATADRTGRKQQKQHSVHRQFTYL